MTGQAADIGWPNTGWTDTDDKDPRRWITLVITSATVVIVSLDTTVLNVAIPTILRDFHTTLPSLQWVITGYALTFASLLIIGGRLGDLFGHRRIFIVGAALFGAGSLMAALSQSVPQLVIGEAIIEGIGAALMMPSSLAIVSRTFPDGRERAIAFGIWGAVGGASGALGPVVGGILTSNASWRWSFGINVVIVPIAIVGAVIVMPSMKPSKNRQRLDLSGALLVAVGMALLVFGLSEGSTYGWVTPIRGFNLNGHEVWSSSHAVSVVAIAFVLGLVLLTVFYRMSRTKERNDAGPLLEFSQFRHRGFRYGIIATGVLSLGQLGLSFVLPVFLQEGRHLSAQTNGLWQLPVGLFFIIGAQTGSRVARHLPLVRLIQIGLGLSVCGFTYVVLVISPDLQFLTLLPGFALYGIGFGFALPALTNVVLTDVEASKAGAAGGANNTARQMGVSLGIAVIGSLLSARTISAALTRVSAAGDLSPGVKTAAAALLRSHGVTFAPPTQATPAEVTTLHQIFVESLASGARWPLLFSVVTCLAALLVACFIPRSSHAAELDDELGAASAH